MSKPRNARPTIHVTRGSERVSIGGRWHILGPVGSAKARAEYARVLALLASDPMARLSKPESYLIVTLCKDYAASDEIPVKSMRQYLRAAEILCESHPATPAAEFGPLALGAWQKSLCDKSDATGRKLYSRKYVVMLVSIIRTIFRWGVKTERIPAEVYHGLLTVSRPKFGQARPGKVVRPVSDEDVVRTLPKLPRSVAGLVRLQRATGARPSEIRGLRPCDVDRSDDVWTFTPTEHKTAATGHVRVIYFGPIAKSILAEFDPGLPELYYFPVRRKWKTEGKPYRKDSYRRAVVRACKAAGVPPWNPYQLRHARITEVRKAAGIEAAQAIGGHSNLSTTEIYAKRVEEFARKAAGESG
jgi:integrase